jgi:methylglutaconyl-CoA hydratase
MPNFVHHAIYKGIATISLNRPDLHNAFNEVLVEELTAEFLEVGTQDDVRLVVLAGEGRSFCAGADLNWMRAMVDYTFEENVADAVSLGRMLRMIRDCPKPTIARVHGPAYGGGVGLVAACDLAVAMEKVKFCLSEVKLGLAPAVISPFLIGRMNASALRRYALTGEPFDAVDAQRAGLVTEVVENFGELDKWINEIADAIRGAAPGAVAACKSTLHAVRDMPIDEAQAWTARQIAELRASKEGQEGLKAFLEKRRPSWIIEE